MIYVCKYDLFFLLLCKYIYNNYLVSEINNNINKLIINFI